VLLILIVLVDLALVVLLTAATGFLSLMVPCDELRRIKLSSELVNVALVVLITATTGLLTLVTTISLDLNSPELLV